MKRLSLVLILALLSCKNSSEREKEEFPESKRSFFTEVEQEIILQNDSLSIRAIQVVGNDVAIAGNHGVFGFYNSKTGKWKTNIQKYEDYVPEFRSIANTSQDFFFLSVASPALLFKTGNSGELELVYKEDDEKAFYDAMAFWNDTEGIAMGDPTDSCISIIITRDGGNTWDKIECSALPPAAEGEAAFAASNSNIAIEGDRTWILTGGMQSNILYSPDRGKSWELITTPLINGKPTTGGYSMDFYDRNTGIIIGGDYTKPEGNVANKAVTNDGGKTWKLVAQNKIPGYKSSIRYVPNSDGKEIIAVGFTGIDYSSNGGESWNTLSDEGYYTIRFVNDTMAYAAGKGRVAKLTFK